MIRLEGVLGKTQTGRNDPIAEIREAQVRESRAGEKRVILGGERVRDDRETS